MGLDQVVPQIGERLGMSRPSVESTLFRARRRLSEEYEAQIDVNDDGIIRVYARTGALGDALVERIESMTKDVEVGDTFTGKVVKTTTFGAFVELSKGTDGLLHISNVKPGERVDTVEDVLERGQEIDVRVVEVDRERGRIGLRLADDPEVDGKTAQLAKDDVLYLQPGSVRTVKAGATGWKAFEVYSPVRLDHLKLAGQDTSAANATFADQGVSPSLPAGVVVNVNEIQWTPLTDPVPGKSYRRSTANAPTVIAP